MKYYCGELSFLICIDMVIWIQKPNPKGILFTTLWCAIAGAISEFLVVKTTSIGRVDLFWYAPSVLFSIAVLLSFRTVARISVPRIISMPLVMWGIYYLSAYIIGSVSDEWPADSHPLLRQVSGLILYSLPGLLVMAAVGIILKIPISILNVLISGICSAISLSVSLDLGGRDFSTDFIGPLFILWQALVGFSLGLVNAGK